MNEVLIIGGMKYTAVAVVSALLCLLQFSQATGTEPEGKLLFPVKYHRVTTHTVFAIETSTTFPYCVAGAYNTNLCAKRRRRRKRDSLTVSEVDGKSGISLEGTMEDGSKITIPESKKYSGKVLTMSIWKTETSTTSLTLLYTDPATTLSLSLVCIPPGGSIPPRC
ncbi:hypothetical protein Avbf_17834 [Armadillidium vulgare]|nr:hypothetical protein Avbf_17834 [Armadillidium vulgare]